MTESRAAAVTAALAAALVAGFLEPFSADVAAYVSETSTGPERDAEMAALKAADEECDRANRDAMLSVLEAAAPHLEPSGDGDGCGPEVSDRVKTEMDAATALVLARSDRMAALEEALREAVEWITCLLQYDGNESDDERIERLRKVQDGDQ